MAGQITISFSTNGRRKGEKKSESLLAEKGLQLVPFWTESSTQQPDVIEEGKS